MAREIIARDRSVDVLLCVDGWPHPGLVFDRFPRLLGKTAGHFDIDERARREWLDEFLRMAAATPSRKDRIASVHARLDAVVSAMGGDRREFRTAWRLATGLGNPNVADIGFSFDAACGVPALPGSAVKGLARSGSWLCDAAEPERISVLGDGPNDEDPGSAGTVIFLDALPARWPEFEIDIITRHHDAEALPSQWIPLDTDAPNPVHFLTVRPGQVLIFRLLPRHGASEDALSLAWTWLERALDDLGAGAKTAVGYGQMLPV